MSDVLCSDYTLPPVSLDAMDIGKVLKMYNRDMPPAGGFEAIKYKRNLPVRGPGAYGILFGVTAVCCYGFYRVGKGNLERRSASVFPWSAGQMC